MPPKNEFQNTIEEMLRLSATRLPQDVTEALKVAKENESDSIAEGQLGAILKNLRIAREKNAPICQDTGIPIFFIKKGQESEFDFDLKKVIEESIEKATESVPLRPNVVDPLSRKNSGNNLGEKHPLIHIETQPGKGFEIELMLKGAGSENWSRLFMMKPTSSKEKIKEKVIQTVKEAGGQTCPPIIIGLGIGGTSEKASLIAKKALLKPLNKENENDELANFEKEITESVNELGVGPMGLGGKTTALGTRIEKAGCHTASLPVAINFQCWAARRAKAQIKDDGLEIEVP
ncbi:hypothetical protein AKJ53_00200 [candidate division MSBL1 archaeon SCGC-AAA382F02]|uniref:Fe-S hydro-lyase tartrate dehydratase alpha-type catalytic domain-containing protein n=1 Tax=candidate division MSBL1 archaeon SCGC-AAA382F02 TaxID=1698282 RepID=A0A133VJ53_9EURY|nr:hypothetical protein AKJ53_00200 [candidate division MSBL1 archaeon SCGC-AAA382F02]